MRKWPKLLTAAGGVTLLLLITACESYFFYPAPQFEVEYSGSGAFVNWETPHVSPLALGKDGGRLYAVNTPADCVEIFDVTTGTPRHSGSIPVGLDPVSVRPRTETEIWVVNHVSDSISIIDTERMTVIQTLHPGDEPADVAFAAGRAFVTCSQINTVAVFELNDLAAPPQILAIEGEDPRALAVSPDGATVYAAVFQSGNHTTLAPWEFVSDSSGPYQGVNPPPNAGVAFDPPLNPDLPPAPPGSIIVRKDAATGQWLDDVGGDWSAMIYWDQHDHDIARIDASSLAISYTTRLMNACMQLAVHPDGRVIVVGTDATNEIRFEPNLTGKFVHSIAAIFDDSVGTGPQLHDLNPHLADAYATGAKTVDANLREQSLADPRGVAFTADGQRGFVTGMGSNNVAVIDADAQVLAQINVGEGPTGIVVDDSRGLLYVLNRFDASISTVDLDTQTEIERTPFFDPTPGSIRAGRPFLYDAQLTSGLGVTACGACHIDARNDQLAWDLGDPSGAMKPFDQTCNHPFLDLPVGQCEDWHPLKGPMTTQTLQHIIGTEPFHWRGDRENLAAFNGAFVSLLGRDQKLSDDQMHAFGEFLGTIQFPPNPNTHLDGSLKEWLSDGSTPIDGSPANGRRLFFKKGIDLGLARCNDCHDIPELGVGTNHKITPRELLIIPHQSIKVPQIRDMFEKTGFSRESTSNNLGFGHNHDGNVDGLVNFFHIPNFTGFSEGKQGEQERRDIISFVFSMSTDTHAAVGAQVTLAGAPDAAQMDRLELFRGLADAGVVGVVAQGEYRGELRGFAYFGDGVFQSDRFAELVAWDELRSGANADNILTWTVTPAGSEKRIGIDRDLNGVLNGDEPGPTPSP